MNDVIIRHSETGYYLLSVYIGRNSIIAPYLFVSKSQDALVFENEETAQATIDFISNVIDFELAECLEIIICP